MWKCEHGFGAGEGGGEQDDDLSTGIGLMIWDNELILQEKKGLQSRVRKKKNQGRVLIGLAGVGPCLFHQSQRPGGLRASFCTGYQKPWGKGSWEDTNEVYWYFEPFLPIWSWDLYLVFCREHCKDGILDGVVWGLKGPWNAIGKKDVGYSETMG